MLMLLMNKLWNRMTLSVLLDPPEMSVSLAPNRDWWIKLRYVLTLPAWIDVTVGRIYLQVVTPERTLMDSECILIVL